jgi:hypothetical protein
MVRAPLDFGGFGSHLQALEPAEHHN